MDLHYGRLLRRLLDNELEVFHRFLSLLNCEQDIFQSSVQLLRMNTPHPFHGR
jgi:hypothetical protein